MTLVLAGLAVGDDTTAWTAAGFAVGAGALRIGPITIECRGDGSTPTLLGHDDPLDLDGLGVGMLTQQPPDVTHPNTVTGLDHVVLATPSQERTQAAFARIGLDCRRVRDVGTPEKPFEQRFYRLGPCIAEVVGPPSSDRDDPLRVWGLAFVASDIDAAAAVLGDRLGPVKDAVQPGRRIATVRHEALGITLPVAFMTPRP